jgi:hypothetical protein
VSWRRQTSSSSQLREAFPRMVSRSEPYRIGASRLKALFDRLP